MMTEEEVNARMREKLDYMITKAIEIRKSALNKNSTSINMEEIVLRDHGMQKE